MVRISLTFRVAGLAYLADLDVGVELDKLVDVDLPPVEGRRAENTHFEWADLERAGGSIYGYGIDWVLPEDATIAI